VKKTLALLFLLSACSVGSSQPELVNVNGVEGYRIVGGKMLGVAEPTPENIASVLPALKNGDHGAGLKPQALKICPSGYKILQEGEPRATIYVYKPYVQHKVYQDFVIACT
jgi:hypothetical protein